MYIYWCRQTIPQWVWMFTVYKIVIDKGQVLIKILWLLIGRSQWQSLFLGTRPILRFSLRIKNGQIWSKQIANQTRDFTPDQQEAGFNMVLPWIENNNRILTWFDSIWPMHLVDMGLSKTLNSHRICMGFDVAPSFWTDPNKKWKTIVLESMDSPFLSWFSHRKQ